MDTFINLKPARTALLSVASLLIGYLILRWIFRKPSKNVPPGPREWGTNWRIMRASWDGTFPVLASEWARKYGDMTFVYSLGKPILFLNSPAIIRELVASEKYKFLMADRPQVSASRFAKFNGKDLLFSNFDGIMRKKRRMFYSVLSMYGDGVNKFENIVWGELERMFSEIDSAGGKDTDISNILVRSLKNIIYILTHGEPPVDPSIPDTLEEYDMAFNVLGRADMDVVVNHLPFVVYIPGKFKRAVDRLARAKEKADELFFFGPKKTYIPGQPRGIIDILLDYKKKPGYEWLDEEHIIAFLATLFMAAHLTSRASLTGVFLCLFNYPEVSRKIQEEVDTIIGDDRPKVEHRKLMPYTEATILESLRIISQVPLSGIRNTSEDIEYNGFHIPKNTLVFMNNWFFLHDENLWEDPWSFTPERFLDSGGKLLPPDHPHRRDLITFGIGVRACPGEVFARSRVFLFITSILQRYDLFPPANSKLPRADFQEHDESILGLVRQTAPYRGRLLLRKKAQN